MIDHVVEIPVELKLRFDHVIEMMKEDQSRVDLASLWRKWSFFTGTRKTGRPLEKIKKLQLSLLAYFKQESQEKGKLFIKELLSQLEQEWNIQLMLKDDETDNETSQNGDKI